MDTAERRPAPVALAGLLRLVRVCRELQPDVVLRDVRMPSLDGYVVAAGEGRERG